MVIAIDFDGTFTNDPEMWTIVISLIRGSGHSVICATARTMTPENEAETLSALPQGVPVVFCGDRAKELAALEAGYVVNIWIDDNPERCKKPFIPVGRRIARRQWA